MASPSQRGDSDHQKRDDKFRQEVSREKIEKAQERRTRVSAGDPTSDFERMPNGAFEFEPDQIQHWTDATQEHRLLVMPSRDGHVLRSAVERIVDAIAYDARQWDLGSINDLEVCSCKAILQGAYERETLIAVYLQSSNDRAVKFLSTLPGEALSVLRELSDQMKSVVVLVHPDQLRNFRNLDYVEPEISYVEPLIRSAYSETYLQLASELKQLKARRRWGSTEEDAWAYTRQHVQSKTLVEEIRARNEPNWNESSVPEVLLEDGKVLDNAIRFVGCYFVGNDPFSPDEFNEVLGRILGDQREPQQPALSADQPPPEPRLLREIWSRDQHRLIRDNGLCLTPSTDGLTVSFQNVEHLSQLRRQFQTDFYWDFDQMATRCLAANMLSDPSRRIRLRMISILQSKLMLAGTAFGTNLLTDVTKAAGISHTIASGSPLHRGVVELLNETASSTAHANFVFASLESLLAAKSHGLAWSLANRLVPPVEHQDKHLRLLKRLFDESPADLGDFDRATLQEEMLDMLVNGRVYGFQSFVQGMLGWIRPESEEKSVSRSHDFGLHILRELARYLIEHPLTEPGTLLFTAGTEVLQDLIGQNLLRAHRTQPADISRRATDDIEDFVDIVRAFLPTADALPSSVSFGANWFQTCVAGQHDLLRCVLALVSSAKAADVDRGRAAVLLTAFNKSLSREERALFSQRLTDLDEACIFAVNEAAAGLSPEERLTPEERRACMKDLRETRQAIRPVRLALKSIVEVKS